MDHYVFHMSLGKYKKNQFENSKITGVGIVCNKPN